MLGYLYMNLGAFWFQFVYFSHFYLLARHIYCICNFIRMEASFFSLHFNSKYYIHQNDKNFSDILWWSTFKCLIKKHTIQKVSIIWLLKSDVHTQFLMQNFNLEVLGGWVGKDIFIMTFSVTKWFQRKSHFKRKNILKR